MFHSVTTFCLSGPTGLVATSVYLKAAVKFCTVDLSTLPAKKMVCDFKRIYILPSCGGEKNINYVSPPVGINSRKSDLH